MSFIQSIGLAAAITICAFVVGGSILAVSLYIESRLDSFAAFVVVLITLIVLTTGTASWALIRLGLE